MREKGRQELINKSLRWILVKGLNCICVMQMENKENTSSKLSKHFKLNVYKHGQGYSTKCT